MAIRSEAEWKSLPEIIYQYLDLYFKSSGRRETHILSRQLQLEPDVADRIRCSIRLFHAANDALARTNAPQIYRELVRHGILSERIVADRHGCLLHLAEFGAELVPWCEGLTHHAPNKQAEN